MLVEAFKSSVFPYLVQIGVIAFAFCTCQYAYALFRQPNWQQFLDKMKGAIVAYAVVKGAFTIVSFIDKMIGKM